MTAEERCKRWDFLVSQCGCPEHRGGKVVDPTEGMVLGTVTTAKFPGHCALDDDHLIRKADLIGEVRETTDAVLREGDAQWACELCTRKMSNRRAGRGVTLL